MNFRCTHLGKFCLFCVTFEESLLDHGTRLPALLTFTGYNAVESLMLHLSMIKRKWGNFQFVQFRCKHLSTYIARKAQFTASIQYSCFLVQVRHESRMVMYCHDTIRFDFYKFDLCKKRRTEETKTPFCIACIYEI